MALALLAITFGNLAVCGPGGPGWEGWEGGRVILKSKRVYEGDIVVTRPMSIRSSSRFVSVLQFSRLTSYPFVLLSCLSDVCGERERSWILRPHEQNCTSLSHLSSPISLHSTLKVALCLACMCMHIQDVPGYCSPGACHMHVHVYMWICMRSACFLYEENNNV
jgi:hypothetical protein